MEIDLLPSSILMPVLYDPRDRVAMLDFDRDLPQISAPLCCGSDRGLLLQEPKIFLLGAMSETGLDPFTDFG